MINRRTGIEDIQFWLDPERKGWTKADHEFYDQLKANGEDMPCYLLRCVKELVDVEAQRTTPMPEEAEAILASIKAATCHRVHDLI